MSTATAQKKNLKRILSDILFWGVLLVCAIVIAMSLLTKDANTVLFGKQLSIVLSDSMSPTFHAGSLLVLEDIAPADIQKGDIIAFRSSNETVTHRVIEIYVENGRYSFSTQGDANNTPDTNLVSEEQIQGAAVAWMEYAGRIMLWLKNPITLLSICMAILDLFIIKQLLQRENDENINSSKT